MPNAFISYAGEDELYARAINSWMSARGWRVFDFKDSMKVDADWDVQLKRAIRSADLVIVIYSRHWASSKYCAKELAFSESASIPTTAIHIPGSTSGDVTDNWLKRKQQFRLSVEEIEEADAISVEFKGASHTIYLERLGKLALGQYLSSLAPISPDDFDLPKSVSEPYPGPRPLAVDEAAIFFGRDEEITDCLAALRSLVTYNKTGVMFISGPSGAGKSSFMRAGIAARVFRATSEFYAMPIVSVTNRPITGQDGFEQSLKAVLAEFGSQDPSIGKLLSSPGSLLSSHLRRLVDNRTGRENLPIIIILDQGEELLLKSDEENGVDEREAFRKLLNGILSSNQKVFILTTVRHELFERFQHYWPADVKREPFHLGPLKRTNYRDVISKPLQRKAFENISLSQVLVNRLVDDVMLHQVDNPLPSLAFTLQRLWQNRTGSEIHSEEYKGLEAAIISAGDDAREKLRIYFYGEARSRVEAQASVDRELSSFLFRYFLSMDEKGEVRTRRCSREKIQGLRDNKIIEFLLDSRIVVGSSHDAYEPAHEKVVQDWKWLNEQITERRDDLKLRAGLETNAWRWERDRRLPGSAVSTVADWDAVMRISDGDPKLFAEKFQAKTGVEIPAAVQEYIAACSEADQRHEAEIGTRINIALGEQSKIHTREKQDLNEQIKDAKARSLKYSEEMNAAKRTRDSWRNRTLMAAVFSLVLLVWLGYGVYQDFVANQQAAQLQADSAAKEADAESAASRAAEQSRKQQAVNFVTDIAGCWKAFANPDGNCWEFQLSQIGDGVMQYVCKGGVPTPMSLAERSMVGTRGGTYTLDQTNLMLRREGNLVAVYERCE